MNTQNAVKQYQTANSQGKIEDASPHQLIHLLMEGALTRIAQAKSCIAHDAMADKSVQIGKAISIIGGLQGSLDMNAEGDISENLDALYDYMVRKLLDANVKNDPAILDEISGLLREIKDAWDSIPAEFHHATQKTASR
ncbi:MAG: flagellar export chaperone FliS [Gammaproteobacteria bacterium]|nr:flagellar export chaperone FliS [Gammaproteobacteria bacterium]